MTRRIAALDGWRGIAILLVLTDHVSSVQPKSWIPTGEHGVVAFFVLSGYLITNKLLESSDTLLQFYAKRFFRLMPVAWTFLLAMCAAGFLKQTDSVPPHGLLASIFFVRNYFGDVDSGMTMHYWSLSVEEQFYIVWPSLLLFLGIARAKCIAVCCIIAGYGWYLLHRSLYDSTAFCFHTEVQATGLLVGCLLAMTIRTDSAKTRFVGLMRWLFGPCIAFLTWITFQVQLVPSPLECLAWGMVIVYTTFEFSGLVSFPTLTWLGRISYSIYVWNKFSLDVLTSFSSELRFAAILIPIASYYLIERPGLRFSRRLLNMPMQNSRPRLEPKQRPETLEYRLGR